MSRFKFACSCGKRLAAYDWMVGRILTCPNCGRTLTVPTPFKAQEKLDEMIDKGYSPAKRKIGRPVDRGARRRRIAVILGVVLVVLAAAAAVVLLFLR